MHFNFHLSGDESPEQSRRIANAVLALGGLLGAQPDTVQTHIIRTGEISPELRQALKDGASANVSVGYRVTEGATSSVTREELIDRADLSMPDLDLPPTRYTSYDLVTGASLIPEPMSTNELRDLISSPCVPPVPTFTPDQAEATREQAVAARGPTTDAKGLPWDERIHSSNRKLNADGTWRYRKNVPDETKRDVEAELRGAITVGQTVTVPEVPSLNADLSNIVDYAGAKSIPVPPLPPTPPAPPVPAGALQRTYSDVVNLIMARKVQPDTYVAILGMSLPEFAKHVISAPNDATLMFDALDQASRP